MKERCPTCGHILSERQIALYSGLVSALLRVFRWCEEKGKHEFTRREVKHLFLNENDTARFGDWVMFGGLVYKVGKAHYGLNMERCNQFFAGKYEIPISIWKNPITGELRKEEYRSIEKIPSILHLLNEDKQYIARYRNGNVAEIAGKKVEIFAPKKKEESKLL